MAEFKFSCPQCAQHIQCDTGYAGAQINCPTCHQSIVVPPPPRSAAAPVAAPPPPPMSISMRQSAPAPAAPRQQVGMPAKQPAKSKTFRNVLIITASVVVLAALGFAGWFGYSKYKKAQAKKGNPAAQVAAPTAAATVQAFSILTKVHSAYTNITSVRMDGTLNVFLDLSKVTAADLNPNASAAAKNSTRRQQGMPSIITNTTELSVRSAKPNSYYVAGEAVSKVDHLASTYTFAYWSSDKGKFMFTDSHMRGVSASYMQLADTNAANVQPDQLKNMQHVFEDPANLTKIIKDLGQTGDETVNGQSYYTLTGKVLGQKIKVWVDKTTYIISQWEITLGGAISDADIDDVFELYGAIDTNTPPMALNMVKDQVKKMAPVMAKIRGTITSSSKNIELNPTLSADDFNYAVPPGVRLVRMPTAATRATRAPASPVDKETAQRNACINNLRQIDAAKNEFALEKGKANGTAVTEDDIKPYIKLDADGNLPKCPSGGKYTIGKVGEKPTCSTAGHLLP